MTQLTEKTEIPLGLVPLTNTKWLAFSWAWKARNWTCESPLDFSLLLLRIPLCADFQWWWWKASKEAIWVVGPLSWHVRFPSEERSNSWIERTSQGVCAETIRWPIVKKKCDFRLHGILQMSWFRTPFCQHYCPLKWLSSIKNFY